MRASRLFGQFAHGSITLAVFVDFAPPEFRD
jgi:hypothetical protein